MGKIFDINLNYCFRRVFYVKGCKNQFKWWAEKAGFNFNLLDDGFGDVPNAHAFKHGSCRRGVSINLTLNSTDGSEVKGWMDKNASPKGALADADAVKSAGDINITLTNDITVTSYSNKMASSYFFNFTDARFAGKTITIDGGNHKITINNANLFFLSLKDCTVILKNITIDGNNTNRLDSGL